MTKRDELVERIKQRLKSLVPVDYGMRDEEAKSYARAAIAECEKDRVYLEAQCAVMRAAQDWIEQHIRETTPDYSDAAFQAGPHVYGDK